MRGERHQNGPVTIAACGPPPLPGGPDCEAGFCRAEAVRQQLAHCGYPLAAVQVLTAGDYTGVIEWMRELLRGELAAYGNQVRGRDALLARSARAGITEVEAAQLSTLSRNTVRSALGK